MIGKFWDALKALPPGRVRLLECGTRHTAGNPPSSRREEAVALRRDLTHTGLDLAPGPGVLEHVRRPWEAARQLARVVRPGGLLYCQSHQTFPLHLHPGDYFRFTAEALREVFAADAGWRVLDAGHEFPCAVLPLGNHFTHARGWNFAAPAYLNSWAMAERAG
jgi:hypothetical protein